MKNFNKEDSKMNIIVCCSSEEKEKLLNFLFEDEKEYQIQIQKEMHTLIAKNDLNWGYIFFNEGLNDESIKTINDYIKQNYKKNKLLNTVIISIINEKIDEDLKFLEFFKNGQVPYCLRPMIIFITNDERKNKKYYKNYIEKNDLDFEEDNIFILRKNESILMKELPIRLWKTCCYYNQISDEVIFPEIINDETKKENIEKFKHCINFFNTGKPGVGKSTFINVLSRYKKVKVGIGSSQTNKVNRYLIDGTNICIYDSPGFNNFEELKKTKKIIQKKIEGIINDKEQISGVFYFFDSVNNKRTLDEEELNFIKFLIELKFIKIFFLLNFTKTKNISNKIKKERKSFFTTLKSELQNEFGDKIDINQIYEINLKNDDEGEIFGLDKLFKDLYQIYKPNKIDINRLNKLDINSKNLENDIKEILTPSIYFNYEINRETIFQSCRKLARYIIQGSTLLGLIASVSPIPIHDVFVLSGMELAMVGGILGIYGHKTDEIQKKELIKSFALTAGIGATGWGTANVLKCLPFLGTVIGSGISGATTVVSFVIIGNKTIDYCEKKFDNEQFLNFYIDASKSFNKATDDLEKLSKINYSEEIEEIEIEEKINNNDNHCSLDINENMKEEINEKQNNNINEIKSEDNFI